MLNIDVLLRFLRDKADRCVSVTVRPASTGALLAHITELTAQVSDLRELALAQREWIDAVPNDTVLPEMPGHDRDWADSVLAKTAPATKTTDSHKDTQ